MSAKRLNAPMIVARWFLVPMLHSFQQPDQNIDPHLFDRIQNQPSHPTKSSPNLLRRNLKTLRRDPNSLA